MCASQSESSIAIHTGEQNKMSKLVVAWMVENDEQVWRLSYESVKNVADAFVVVDGNHHPENVFGIFWNVFDNDKVAYDEAEEYEDGTPIPEQARRYKIIESAYPHDDKGADGKQRNKYLQYLKENHLGDWCLVLDADEFVDKPNQIKKVIELLEANNAEVCSPRMIHFIGDLAHEDSTLEKHYVPCRLFKVTPDLWYPEVEHNTLQGFRGNVAQEDMFIVWHLGYVKDKITELKRKYLNHTAKSNIHNQDFLDQWYCAHLFGTYPRKPLNIQMLPPALLDFLQVPDYFYFHNRGLETKHSLMVKQWYDHFKPESILDLGCGRGPYLFYWGWLVKKARGIELSNWAVEHAFTTDIKQGDITTMYIGAGWDLITCIDVLEHLTDEQLEAALKNISEKANNYLFSIPFIGDSNLHNDSTHKQFMTKEEWIAKIESHGIKVIPTPDNFYFKEQLLVGVNNASS